MWVTIIGFVGKILPFIKELFLVGVGIYTGKTIEENKHLEAENAVKETTIKVDNDISKLSDDDVLNQLRNDADNKPDKK